MRQRRKVERQQRWIASLSDRDWARLAERADQVNTGQNFARFDDLDAPIAVGVYATLTSVKGGVPEPTTEATHDVHQRLHRHNGFAAIQNTTIDIASYRRLLICLYGFYVPFETVADIGRDRSAWLEHDLRALGLDRQELGAIAICNDIPSLMSADARLGALYVVEGSALGGRDLGRNLDRLLGWETINGRRFFLGRGSGTG